MTASSGSGRPPWTVAARALPLALLAAGMMVSGQSQRAAWAEAPAAGSGARVETDRLDVVEVDTTGALSLADGALPIEMWRDTPRSLIDTLLPRLPVETPSPAMRSMMRRLLLTGAAMPRSGGQPGRLLDLRATMLWRMGDTAGLLRLIGAAPADARSESLWRLDTDTRLLAGDAAAACRTAQERVGLDPDDYWQKVLGFCQALAGDADGASLTIALLAERDVDVGVYRSLINALGSGRGALSRLTELSPLDVAMLRAAGLSPSLPVAEDEELPVLMTIARAETFAAPIRLGAAERAATVGILPADEFYPLLERVRPGRMLPPSREGGTTEAPSASATAVLREALADEGGTARGAWAAKVLEAGRQGGDWLRAMRLVAPWLISAVPSPGLIEAAPSIVPALLVLGERVLAESWLDWLAAEGRVEPKAAEALQALLPLARLARLNQAQAASPEGLRQWVQSVQGQTVQRLRIERLLTMLQANGETVPDSLWQSLLQGPAQVSGTGVDAAFRAALDRAARSRRTGETVLLALVSLGTEGPPALDTSSMQLIVDGLRAVGLEADARALAVEAVAGR